VLCVLLRAYQSGCVIAADLPVSLNIVNTDNPDAASETRDNAVPRQPAAAACGTAMPHW
jgi:hypothetical protein